MDIRVQDYLDDKFQSSADLESLEVLLETVKSQQELLKKQLDEARREHATAKRKAEEHTDSIRHNAHAFEKEQGDIDRRLLIVTQSETSDDAVEKFEASMERLRKLDVAAGYVELLQEVDRLGTECTSQLGKSDEAALEPYRQLQRLVTNMRPLQEAAEGAAPHLSDYVAARVHELRQAIQKSFSADLEATLKKINWPMPADKVPMTIPLALQNEWATNVARLLNLQQQELLDREHRMLRSSLTSDPPALLPLEVMVHPLEQRFIYHFSGNRPTNRLDKPEYFLHKILELLATYLTFLQNALQPLLIQQFRGTDLALTPAYIDVSTAFITALLPILQRKLINFANQVSSQPQLLSHLVHEVMSFDTTLQESYGYSPTSPSLPWRGLSYFLLDTCSYFQPWLSVERDFALARYQSIIDAPDAGELDYDTLGSDATKPMKAAIRLNDLLETITDRYRQLASFSQKIRFLIDIQISIFDRFNLRLRNSLDAFAASSSTIGRAVPGVSSEHQSEVQGIKGLDRLCRVFGSADYLERAMRDWSDDVFFLELYEELQSRLGNPAEQAGKTNLGDIQEIQQKTSASVGDDEDDDGELRGALFDETANLYQRLRVRSEAMITEMLVYNLREALRPYAAIGTWASLLSSNSAEGSTSAELDVALRLVSDYFGFLSKAVGKLALRRVSRTTLHALQTYIWDQVLLRHFFSTAGAAQLSFDVRALCALVDGFVGANQGRLGTRKVVEGVLLVGLPVRGGGGKQQRRGEMMDESDDEEEDEGAAAWEDGGDFNAEDAETLHEDGREKQLGLFEVDRRMFTDNESAREVLRVLGVESLGVGDAREVLKRRVEVRS